MLDRIFTPLLMLAALVWTVASFGAALQIAPPAVPARPVAQVELPRVVVTAKRAPQAVAHNDAGSQQALR